MKKLLELPVDQPNDLPQALALWLAFIAANMACLFMMGLLLFM